MFYKIILLFFINLIYLNATSLNCATTNAIKKYNGHYYTITSHRMTFEAAKAFAEKNGGYLAIPNSAAENNFLKSLIPSAKYAWIGVYDPQYTSNYCYGGNCLYDDSRFRDIKGNALTYTNWASAQPDNLVKEYDILDGKQLVSPLGEHWVAMSSLDGKWADFGNHADEHNNPVKFYALIEFESMPDCYQAPSTTTDTYSGAKCNTQVYDRTSGVVSSGQTHTCRKDPKGVYYCPVGLAPCADAWDYKDGYSVERTRIVEKEYDTIVSTVGYFMHEGWHKKLYIYEANFRISDIKKVKKFVLSRIHSDDYSMVVINGHILATIGFSGNTLKVVGDKIQINENPDRFIYNWFGPYGWHYLNKDAKPYLRSGSNTIKVYNVVGKNGDAVALFDIIADKDVVVCNNSQYCTIRKTGTVTVQVEETYYEYLCSGTNYYGHSYRPIVTSGSSPTPPPNNCKAKSYRCKPAEHRKCVYVDNKWQCSPFPCFGEGQGDYGDITNEDTPVGLNDANNDGWSDSGSCTGQLYIFNGKDNRCRSKDVFFGLFGGGCCKKDKVFLGLVRCKEEERMLARKNRNGQCHYVGQYCSKKLKLLFSKICIQKKKTYCCFNSKLARIINEQGRPQLNKGWGSAKSPNCKGFTPEEFQKLDFSKMDLSEFFDDLNKEISDKVIKNMTNYIKNNIQMQLQNIAPNP